jgi:hypothetical protein
MRHAHVHTTQVVIKSSSPVFSGSRTTRTVFLVVYYLVLEYFGLAGVWEYDLSHCHTVLPYTRRDALSNLTCVAAHPSDDISLDLL